MCADKREMQIAHFCRSAVVFNLIDGCCHMPFKFDTKMISLTRLQYDEYDI